MCRASAPPYQIQTFEPKIAPQWVWEGSTSKSEKSKDVGMMQDDRQVQDAFRFEAKILSKLGYLTRGFANADFRPTAQEIEVQTILHDRLAERQRASFDLVARDVAELIRVSAGKGCRRHRETVDIQPEGRQSTATHRKHAIRCALRSTPRSARPSFIVRVTNETECSCQLQTKGGQRSARRFMVFGRRSRRLLLQAYPEE
jgi:hypothetical protein